MGQLSGPLLGSNKVPSREDLVGNNAEGLKRELATAADYCVTFFRSNTFRT